MRQLDGSKTARDASASRMPLSANQFDSCYTVHPSYIRVICIVMLSCANCTNEAHAIRPSSIRQEFCALKSLNTFLEYRHSVLSDNSGVNFFNRRSFSEAANLPENSGELASRVKAYERRVSKYQSLIEIDEKPLNFECENIDGDPEGRAMIAFLISKNRLDSKYKYVVVSFRGGLITSVSLEFELP